jgi:hypothetical protein
MQPVDCARCGTRVQVSKSSAVQTSIQWQGDSSACPLRTGLAVGDTCPALADSIRDAVLDGRLEVATGEF